jgi:hypothetical protein
VPPPDLLSAAAALDLLSAPALVSVADLPSILLSWERLLSEPALVSAPDFISVLSAGPAPVVEGRAALLSAFAGALGSAFMSALGSDFISALGRRGLDVGALLHFGLAADGSAAAGVIPGVFGRRRKAGTGDKRHGSNCRKKRFLHSNVSSGGPSWPNSSVEKSTSNDTIRSGIFRRFIFVPF